MAAAVAFRFSNRRIGAHTESCGRESSTAVLYSMTGMSESSICEATKHLFLPILEVHDPLLRCVHCNVFAYQETVKQLAKNRAYRFDEPDSFQIQPRSYLRRWWPRFLSFGAVGLRRTRANSDRASSY